MWATELINVFYDQKKVQGFNSGSWVIWTTKITFETSDSEVQSLKFRPFRKEKTKRQNDKKDIKRFPYCDVHIYVSGLKGFSPRSTTGPRLTF